MPAPLTISELVTGWDAYLIDAYGVLVDHSGVLPGAVEFVAALEARGAPFWVVTNDASRLPETIATRLQGFGINIDADRVLTSGSLLAGWFDENGMRGARTLALGTQDSKAYVERAGGVLANADVSVIALCDDAGFDFLEGIDAALSELFRGIEADDPPRAVLPNPDLIYPKGKGSFGFTAGALALLLEQAVRERFPGIDWSCERLGKPYPPLFEAAKRAAGQRKLVMVGDQLPTDIAGARRAGIDAVLVATGVSNWQASHASWPSELAPTHLLKSLKE